MTAATLECGPATLRRIDAGYPGGPDVPGAQVSAVLRGIDDPVVLVEEHPVDVDRLLRTVLTEAVGGHCAALTVVHPSGWPAPRIARVRRAATAVSDDVTVLSRSAWIRRQFGRDAVIVEIDEALTVISGPEGRTVRSHPTSRHITDLVGTGEVLFDDPLGIGSSTRNDLCAKGIGVRDVVLGVVGESPDSTAPRHRIGRHAAVAAVAVLAVAAAGVHLHRGPAPAVGAESVGGGSVSLVEGRVAVRAPARWPVRRVTGGPGSARLEVSSPEDPAAVLHITQARTPGVTLEATAAVLNRAAAGGPRGVFSAVTPTVVAGRSVLGYREIRPGRVIGWSVLIDGATRIAIGCQSAPGREDSVRTACQEAIASAREVTSRDVPGTDPGPGASN